MRKRKRSTNVKVPNTREKNMLRDVHEDADHMYMLLADLEGDKELKDELAEGIGVLEDLCEALIMQGEVPKRLRDPLRGKTTN